MREKKRSRESLSEGIFVRLDPQTLAWLKTCAKADGDRSVSSVVRKIVADAKASAEFGRAA
jgi:hypothetical protein